MLLFISKSINTNNIYEILRILNAIQTGKGFQQQEKSLIRPITKMPSDSGATNQMAEREDVEPTNWSYSLVKFLTF
jgi:hypothetical protein